MIRLVIIMLLLALLASCAGQDSTHAVANGVPAGSTTAATGGFPLLSLPHGKVTSTVYGEWNVVDSKNATFTANILTLNPLPGEWGWAILDLGPLNNALQVNQILFEGGGDWESVNPPVYAWIGMSNYTKGTWLWSDKLMTCGPLDLTGVPEGTVFTQPEDPKHMYMAIISDRYPVRFGTAAKLDSKPQIFLSDPPVAYESGQWNKFMFNPHQSGVGNILTYCPGTSQKGGIALRYTHNVDHSASWLVTELFNNSQVLDKGLRYDMDYRSDGNMALIVARNDPVSVIRYCTESGPGTFNTPKTAVESDWLPVGFIDPHIALTLDNSNNPHIVFGDVDGKLRYSYGLSSGVWVVTTPGFADCNTWLDIAARNSDILATFCDNSEGTSSLGIGSHVISDSVSNWDPKITVFSQPPKNAGIYGSIKVGPGTRVAIAQYIESSMINPGGLPPGLAFAYLDSGVINSGGWQNISVDDGTDELYGQNYTAGPWCSLGLLNDGTPVIAYQDLTHDYVRMAIGTELNGGTDWHKFIVDTGASNEDVGQYISMDVQPGDSGTPDLIGVAYEVVKASKSSLRFALVVWPTS